MAAPKQRHTKSRRDRRRSHHALSRGRFSLCSKCGEPVMPHRLCPNCGVYAGKEIVDVLAKLTKKEKKKKQKEMAAKEQEQSQKKNLSMADLSKK